MVIMRRNEPPKVHAASYYRSFDPSSVSSIRLLFFFFLLFETLLGRRLIGFSLSLHVSFFPPFFVVVCVHVLVDCWSS